MSNSNDINLLNAAFSAIMKGQIFISEKEFQERQARNDGFTYKRIDVPSFHQVNLIGSNANNITEENNQTPSFDPGQMFVQIIDGKTITINCNLNDTIQIVKTKIQEIEGILPKRQRLKFNGIQLEDGKKLCDYQSMRYESKLQLAFHDRDVIGYFSSDSLDPQWNYDFTNVNDNGATHMRGGILYKRPCGWRRFALKVVNRYDNGDNRWLGTDNMAWPVSYHGTSEYNGKSIADDGFLLSKGKQFDFHHGIYSTPDVDLAENYAQEFDYEGVKYVTIIQNRVNPVNLQKIPNQTGNGEYWGSKNGDDVRPYGICIKKKRSQ
ncbi:34509_t:CDS:1 [Gigaspora margarita]|uniref:34509_t:CDS:1 n=1 Tax=Gigaspora margarita TaxID=4874 RepID=A0ABN7VPG7_GIGMA|nr:34509_t:CDS:1 [Gigaspora margarita]